VRAERAHDKKKRRAPSTTPTGFFFKTP
jgi:hypothetical protein